MKKLLCILLLLPLFVSKAYAETDYAAIGDVFGAQEMEAPLREEERGIAGRLSIDGGYDGRGALHRLWTSFLRHCRDAVRETLGLGTQLTAILLGCSLSSALIADRKQLLWVELSGCSASCLLLVGSVNSLVSQTLETIYRLSDYSRAALPVVFTAAAASGAPSSAAAKYAAISFALDVLMSLSQKCIIPLIDAYLAAILAGSLFPNAFLSGAARFCKWTGGILMTGCTLVFTVYLSMTGIVSSALDAAAVKTARTVISTTLPVIGGMIADASAAVLSAAGIVKSCAGVFGLIAVSAISIAPFAVMGVKTLVLKAVSVLAESLDCPRFSALYAGISTAVSMLMGLLGSCCIMLFLSLVSGMKAVSG